MKNILCAVVLVSSIAFAAPPPAAAAPAAAPAAKAAPAAAAPAAAAVPEADCDMHKGMMQMMTDMKAAKIKSETIKLDNGTTMNCTTDAKNAPAMEKSMAAMEAGMKAAMEGNAKLCAECQGMVAAMKAGKVMGGSGHQGNTWTHTTMTTDAEILKKLHAQADMKPAAPAAKAVPAKKAP